MIRVFIESVGIVAPGLIGWTEACQILNGQQSYEDRGLAAVVPTILPPTERRRSIVSARLALTAAYEAMNAVNPVHQSQSRALASVFASSDGDGQIIYQITDGLAQEVPEISPTRFSNSVHNAAAGYWSIATGLTQASTCLCAFNDTFSAGLLEAIAQVADEGTDVLMTAFDMRFPSPFSDLRNNAIDCAVTLCLSAQRSPHSMASLELEVTRKCAPSKMPACLPQNFSNNPAARGLPLLAALAQSTEQTVYLDYLDQSLAIKLIP